MARLHLELDSTYRDRTQYPYSSNFEALISQSGNKMAYSAIDPISDAAPLFSFTPFSNILGTIQPYTSTLGSSGTLLKLPATQASKIKNYYVGLLIEFNTGSVNIYKRIQCWTFMETASAFDFFLVTFTDGSYPISDTGSAVSVVIVDPSSVSDPYNINLFVPQAYSIPNYYTNYYVYNQTQNQWLTINNYDSETHILSASLQTGNIYTSGSWILNDNYSIRLALPLQYGKVVIGITTSTMTIVNTFRNIIGSFIKILNTKEISRIVGFDSTNSVATVTPQFSSVPSGFYELLEYTRDSMSNIVFNFNEVSAESAVCYKVTLLNIVVPNSVLLGPYGGRAVYYPYLYVGLQAGSSEGKGPNMIASNNPNSSRQLFRVLVDDTIDETRTPFVRLDGNGMVQHIKINPSSSFKLSVHLPDGSLLIPNCSDNFSPLPPNPLVQISAIFYFESVRSF